MLPVSNAFLAAVRNSHSIRSRIRIVTPGATGTNLPGRDLKVIDGQVTLDSTANIRGTADFSLMEPWPNGNTPDDIVPYGTEVQISRGVVLANGAVERCPLGIFKLTEVTQPDVPGPLRVTAQDRMGGIIEAELEKPRDFSSTTTVGDVVSTLVTEVYPNAVIEWDDNSSSTGSAKPLGRRLWAERSRFDFLDMRIKDLGKIWYFDYRGVLVIKTAPSTTVPVSEINAGTNGVLVQASRSLSREDVYNAVVAAGEAIDNLAPVVSVAYDFDPLSVTAWNGPFGKKPFFYTSSGLLTQAQADTAAAAQLEILKGLPYDVQFGMVPNPALEPLDCVRVTYPIDLASQPHSRKELHTLESLVIGLGAFEGMNGATKRTTNSGV